VLEYDDVMNEQRKIIYAQRRLVLSGENIRDTVESMISDVVESALARFAGGQRHVEEWDLEGLMEYAYQHFLPNRTLTAEDLAKMEPEEAKETLLSNALMAYDMKEKAIGSDTMRELERIITLRVVDSKWMEHLDAMDQMRQGIGLRAYGQRDPLVEYKHEAFDMFSEMIKMLQEEIVRYMYFVTVAERPQERKDLIENRSEEAEAAAHKPAVSHKVGRNDPCPCGSGKKYKKCCGKDE